MGDVERSAAAAPQRASAAGNEEAPDRSKAPRAGRADGELLMVAGLFGAALLYADGVITPAISVLSALEGLSHFDPTYKPAVLPATAAALFVLFLLQRRGTGGVGRMIAAIACELMIVWRTGERTLNTIIRSQTDSLERFEKRLEESRLPRVPGTGVFLSRTGEMPPLVLTRAVDRLGTLQERAVLVTIVNEQIPRVMAAQRVALEDRGNGLYLAQLRYGFMQVPDVPSALRLAQFQGAPIDLDDVTYFILHHVTLVSRAAGLRAWGQRLFALLERNFNGAQHDIIPPEQVFTVGIPLYLRSRVSLRRGLEMATRGSRFRTRGLP
jgi:K+ transporter